MRYLPEALRLEGKWPGVAPSIWVSTVLATACGGQRRGFRVDGIDRRHFNSIVKTNGDDWRNLYQKRIFGAASAPGLPYRLLAPEKAESGERYPLVLFLHGAGERGDDNERQLRHGGEHFAGADFRQRFPCWVLAPQCPAGRYWVDMDWRQGDETQSPQPAAPLQMCLDAISELEKEAPVDPQRIYVIGVSMGGFGVWDLVTRYPDAIAAAVPICGGGDPSRAPFIHQTPLWVFHGAEDRVVPPEYSRRMVEAIRAAGGRPRYTEYRGIGHNSWDPALAEPELFPWLFSQRLRR